MAVVDRSFVKMVAYKRLATAAMSFAAGGLLVAVVSMHGKGPTPMVGIALLLFWGGGSWSLYDGVRLWRALRSR